MENRYSDRMGFIKEIQDTANSPDTDLIDRVKQLEDNLQLMVNIISKLTDTELDQNGERVGGITLPTGRRFTSGATSIFGLEDERVDQQFGFMSTGKDFSEFRGYDLTEVITWYDGLQGLSAFYGRGGPIVVARDAEIIAGLFILRSDALIGFEDDQLVGKIVTITTSVGTFGHTIIANSSNTLTVATANPVSQKDVQFEILNTVYLGSGSSPWKRAYVEDTNAGGIRFGLGATANGQNGLLYTEGDNLKFRRKSGTIATLA